MTQENKEKLNFAFWGTPDVASETLEILKQAGYLPSLIITSPDARSGRKMLLTPPPVKTSWAIENGIPFIQPEKLDEELYNKLEAGSYELSLVVAYGKIIPEDIINLPKLGSINIHYSLLPKYRGASPVESAILNGDAETGVTIQQMEYKMDAGAILAQEKTQIALDEKAPNLRKRLIALGGNLLIKTLPDLIAGKIKAVAQNESNSTHCKKIKKEDGLIDLNGDAQTNYNKFRAYATWPRTFFFKPARPHDVSGAGGDNRRIIITQAKLEAGKFVIERIIPEGGKETDYTG